MSDRRGMRSVNWRSMLAAVALSALAIPAATGGSAHAQTVRAPASLVRQAASAPNRMVKVIVEKHGATSLPEQLIHRAGGTVTKNLSIINAVAATVPGWAVRTLGTNSSVNWIAPDAIVHHQNGPDGGISTGNLANNYNRSIGATWLWQHMYQGGGVNVAVVDSGVNPNSDLGSRVVAATSVVPTDATTTDLFGHGTHVAGIIAANGTQTNGQYIGIAPKAGIVSVKVFDAQGNSTVSTVIAGLQWVYNNRLTYNIKVVNLSLDTNLNESYNVDPLDAACEILWFNKMVVVVSGGNNGVTAPGTIYAPANDPFVITVGAVDGTATSSPSSHQLANFSAYGTTIDDFSKPDVVAPGVNIISDLASPTDTLALQHPANVVTNAPAQMFDMSGTSMAAPMVSGAAALLLEVNPNLNPDQVKSLLESTASATASSTGAGAGEVNVGAAYGQASNYWATANTGLAPSAGLRTLNPSVGASWDSASWGSASWGSASWGSASWGSASWGSASWGSASWGSATFSSDYWGNTRRHPHGHDTDTHFHG